MSRYSLASLRKPLYYICFFTLTLTRLCVGVLFFLTSFSLPLPTLYAMYMTGNNAVGFNLQLSFGGPRSSCGQHHSYNRKGMVLCSFKLRTYAFKYRQSFGHVKAGSYLGISETKNQSIQNSFSQIYNEGQIVIRLTCSLNNLLVLVGLGTNLP